MAEVTVKQLAEVVGIPVEKLLKQMKDAGLDHGSSEQVVSDEEKQQLLSHLKQSHGGLTEKKITLKRKSVSTLKVSGQGKSNKTVNVEVRKKRTYIPRSVVMEEMTTQEEIAAAEQREAQEEDVRRAEAEAERAEEAAQVAEAEMAAALQASEAMQQQVSEDELRQQQTLEQEQAQDEEITSASSAPVSTKAKSKSIRTALVSEDEKTRAQQELAQHEQKIKEQLEQKRLEQDRARRQAEQLRKEADEKARQRTLEEARRMAEELEKRDGQSAAEGELVTEDEPDSDDVLVQQAFEESIAEEEKRTKRSRRSAVRHRAKLAKQLSVTHGFTQPTAPIVREVRVGDTIVVSDLANQMSVKAVEVVRQLMKLGVMTTSTKLIDRDTAILVVEEMGHKYALINEDSAEEELKRLLSAAVHSDDEAEIHRAPVVTIMGHVDHGKTSLLDYIRRSKVTAGEAGGITQHIGAYHVETDKGNIAFLDTPGHAAFTAMRARGAQCTDVVILVVAADDGLMPQTEEAIDHARAAGVPIVVAVNKIDKAAADPDRVRNELSARKELVPEEWGGDVQFVNVSAHTGEGIDTLLEAVLLQSEMLELKARASGAASGVVVEARLDKGRGVVATLLVQQGRLQIGDMILAGQHIGRVRAMVDDEGTTPLVAGPSTPVEILGLAGVPDAGDEFLVVPDERKAREVAEHRGLKRRQAKLARVQKANLESLFFGEDGKVSSINVVLKTDVRGSLEALHASLMDLGNDEVAVNIVGSGVGGITESDVNLALTTGAILVGFNVRADATAKKLCQDEGLEIRYYGVIYDIIDDVKAALSGLLQPELREKILGVAEVRDVFRSSKFGVAAGCMVLEGSLLRNKRIRVLRDDIVVFEGELESLRRFKEDVNEVRNGMECGVAVRSYSDIRSGDKVEAYEVKKIARSL
ncbi:MAG: translation initiation factor IF-2 [Gammaproteobacteria bacterium]